jgi:uncharacterized repeat protein (TIGR01451 family)
VTPTGKPDNEESEEEEVDTQSQLILFDPSVSKIGVLQKGDVGLTGEEIEWIIGISNIGTVPGNNISITDNIDNRLAINRVEAPNAEVVIDGQLVTVTYTTINPGETILFSIFTTTIYGEEINNVACVNAMNQANEECALGVIIAELPDTGQSPWSKWRMVVIAIGLISLFTVTTRSLKKTRQST